MGYKRKLQTILIKSLIESMDQPVMIILADRVTSGYDINTQTGYPRNIPIPNQLVAETIVRDMFEMDTILEYISQLILLHQNGFRGKDYVVSGLKEVVKEVLDSGYIYNNNASMFIEDSRKKRTNGWGVLRNGEEYTFSLLKIDIVGNSKLVRKYSPSQIRQAYDGLRNILSEIVFKRNGRIWHWEGDGGIAAFYFTENRHLAAVLCGIEFLHELFLYNNLENPLKEPLSVRIAVHSGPCNFFPLFKDIQKCNSIQELMNQEKNRTESNTVSISPVVGKMLGSKMHEKFRSSSDGYYSYNLEWNIV